jgi:hypothetical protein
MTVFCSGFCIHGQKYIYCRQTGKKKMCQKKYFSGTSHTPGFQTPNQCSISNKEYPISKYTGSLTWALGLSVGYWIFNSQLEEFVIWNRCAFYGTTSAIQGRQANKYGGF